MFTLGVCIKIALNPQNICNISVYSLNSSWQSEFTADALLLNLVYRDKTAKKILSKHLFLFCKYSTYPSIINVPKIQLLI